MFVNVVKKLNGAKNMKKIKCNNCKREYEVEDDVFMSVCGCGYTIEIII